MKNYYCKSIPWLLGVLLLPASCDEVYIVSEIPNFEDPPAVQGAVWRTIPGSQASPLPGSEWSKDIHNGISTYSANGQAVLPIPLEDGDVLHDVVVIGASADEASTISADLRNVPVDLIGEGPELGPQWVGVTKASMASGSEDRVFSMCFSSELDDLLSGIEVSANDSWLLWLNADGGGAGRRIVNRTMILVTPRVQ
jgi:hypothetical protein